MKNVGIRLKRRLKKHLYNYFVNNYLGVMDENNEVTYITLAMRKQFDEYCKELVSGNKVYLPYRLIYKSERMDISNVRLANISCRLSEDHKSISLTITSKSLFDIENPDVVCKTEVIGLSTNILMRKHYRNTCIDVDNTRMIKPIIKNLLDMKPKTHYHQEESLDDSAGDSDAENSNTITDSNITNFVNVLNKYQNELGFLEIPSREDYKDNDAYVLALTAYTKLNVYDKFSILEAKLDLLYRKYKWLVAITNEINEIDNIKVMSELNYYIRFLNTWKSMDYNMGGTRTFYNTLDYICNTYLSAETSLHEGTLAFDNYLSWMVLIHISSEYSLLKSSCSDIVTNNFTDIWNFDTQIYNYLRDKLVLDKDAKHNCFNVYNAILPIYHKVVNTLPSDDYIKFLKSIENYRDIGSDNELFEFINKLNNRYVNK